MIAAISTAVLAGVPAMWPQRFGGRSDLNESSGRCGAMCLSGYMTASCVGAGVSVEAVVFFAILTRIDLGIGREVGRSRLPFVAALTIRKRPGSGPGRRGFGLRTYLWGWLIVGRGPLVRLGVGCRDRRRIYLLSDALPPAVSRSDLGRPLTVCISFGPILRVIGRRAFGLGSLFGVRVEFFFRLFAGDHDVYSGDKRLASDLGLHACRNRGDQLGADIAVVDELARDRVKFFNVFSCAHPRIARLDSRRVQCRHVCVDDRLKLSISQTVEILLGLEAESSTQSLRVVAESFGLREEVLHQVGYLLLLCFESFPALEEGFNLAFGGHADTAFLVEVCREASHCQSTPWIFFRSAAAITPSQCRGEMLSRSLIWRAASYPQPTSVANSPMVSHSSIRAEMEEGVLLMTAIVQKVRRPRKTKSYTLHDIFRP